MGSIPVGSTKKQTQTCLLLLSRLEIEGRRSVVPIPVRSAGSLLYGSTKTTVKTVVFLHPTENRTAVNTARFPYARQARWWTGVQKSRHRRVCFCYPDLKSKDGVPSSRFPTRLRHKVLTRSRALSLPENTASDSRATKSSQNRTKIKKRSEKIDQ